jgi:hypothetical protein
MKSRFWLVFMILITAFFLMGMGKMDETEKPGVIPVPDKEISAIVNDMEGLTLTLTQFSINGQTYLSGKLGAGQAAIPFSKIRVIALASEAKGLAAKIELTDHSQIHLVVEKGAMVYGKIKAGTYQVLLDRLKKIEILGVTESKK